MAKLDLDDDIFGQVVPLIFVLSDARGETANTVVMAAAAQFGDDCVEIKRLSNVKDVDAVRALLDEHFDPDRPCAVFHTFANATLRRRIEAGGGAVCSEYPPGYPGKTKGTFLARNRLIAAQAEVLCVAEARTRSGTLNTVGHAETYGRPVLAVPGSIYSAMSQGTNELLRTHRAEVLCRAQDILERLGAEAQPAAAELPAFSPASVSADARAVYEKLGPTPQGIDALCAATGLPANRVLAACTELELFGGAQAQPGRRYIAL